ncbi:MAG: hypothetical protein NTV75_10875 [Bacteroidia bacterium]|nr:hypothetical protein [Bacteroidia bacterium]
MKKLIIGLLILFVLCETSFGGNSKNNLTLTVRFQQIDIRISA